ncbi:YdbH domain-containing protein [Shewanella sp. YIC-542]|uniref:intermembrane phospholipid transport protein YdbH family protein n=1 Tax=Shewanella mytili TaxID=3377111 RepID=UPI00398F0B74
MTAPAPSSPAARLPRRYRSVVARCLRLALWGVLVLLLLLCSLGWLLVQKQDWWLPQLNRQLQAQNINLTTLEWQIPDRQTLLLPQLILDYQGSKLAFEQLQLRLKQPLTLTRLWQWYQQPAPQLAIGSQQWLLQNLQSVSYQRARLQLTAQQLLPGDSSAPLALPLTDVLPKIHLEHTTLSLLGEHPSRERPFSLYLPQLQLLPDGQFASQVLWQQAAAHTKASWQPLLQLSGNLKATMPAQHSSEQHAWQAQVQLMPQQLLQAATQLAANTETAVLTRAYPWLTTDFLRQLPQLQGTLQLQLQLGLQQGDSALTLCWQAPAVKFPVVPNSRLHITPLPPVITAQAPETQENPSHCLPDAIGLSLNNNARGQHLKLQPVQLQWHGNVRQRQALAQWWDNWRQSHQAEDANAALTPVLERLAKALGQPNAANDEAGLTLTLTQGANANMAKGSITLPQVQLSPAVAGQRQWLTLSLHNLQLTTMPTAIAATGRLPAQTVPSLPHAPSDNAYSPAPHDVMLQQSLQQALARIPALVLHSDWQLQLDLPSGFHWQTADTQFYGQSAKLQLDGTLQLNGATQTLELQINRDARLQGRELSLQQPHMTLNIQQLDSHARGPWQLRLSPRQLQLQLPALEQQLSAVEWRQPTMQASINELHATLPELTLPSWQWTIFPALQQLQRLTLKQQLMFNARQIHVSKTRQTRLGQHTETLLNLNQAGLKEQWHWDGNQLASKEQWQLDKLQLTSEHLLRPHFASAPFSPYPLQGYDLTGHWQLQAPLADIRAQAAKNLVLSGHWQLYGQAAIEADIALQQRGTALTLSGEISPRLHDAHGSYQQLPFEGLQASSLCRFVVDKPARHPATAALNCQQLALQMAAFNPGVLLDNVRINGDISLTPELDAEKRQRAGNWLLPGFNDADIQLAAEANTLGGRLSLPRFRLRLNQPSDAYLMLLGLDLQQLLQANPQQGIAATGLFDGVLPLAITDNRLSVSGGHLASRAPGGVIHVGDNPAVLQMRQSQPYLDFVFSTLEELQYREINSTFDMAPDGEALLNMAIKGHGKGVERPIELNYRHEENLLQLLRSLSIGDRLQTQLEASMQ